MSTLDGFDLAAICSGRSLIRGPDVSDLQDNPPLWKQLWQQHKVECLVDWCRRYPGSRPEAFWRFEGHKDVPEDQQEIDYLHRLNQISPEEIELIAARARELIEYNHGRDPADPKSNFCEDEDGYVAFACKHGLLPGTEKLIKPNI
jgi:hypothetical protein